MKHGRSFTEDVTVSVAYADTGIGWNLRYDLLLSSAEGRSFYSARVTRIDTGESAYVRDITSDTSFARRIFKVLVRGTVTPCCAHEVVEELIELIW